MNNTKLLIFSLLLISVKFNYAQGLVDLHTDEKSNQFEILTLDKNYNSNILSFNYNINSLSTFKFYSPIRYFNNYTATNVPTASPSEVYQRNYPVNRITDSAFEVNEHLLENEITWCNTDSTECTVSNSYSFMHINHFIDTATDYIYRLAYLTKSTIEPYQLNLITTVYKNPYILKSKKYPSNNQTYPYYPNKIEQYYKLPFGIKAYKMLQVNTNSIMLLSADLETVNNNTVVTIHQTELDSTLQVVQTRDIKHVQDNPINAVSDIDFYSINNKYYYNITDKYNLTGSSYIWEHDLNYNPLDSLKFDFDNSTIFAEDFSAENYFNIKRGIHYLKQRNDSLNIIHVTNAVNDTIRKIMLPNLSYNKVLIAKDSSFILLNIEPDYQLGSNSIFIYRWNKSGQFMYKKSMYEAFNYINYTLYYGFDKFSYDIDSFNNIALAYSLTTAATSSNFNQEYYYYFFSLDQLNSLSGKITSDINRNCLHDSLEPAAKNILVELLLNGKKYFTSSDDSGSYKFTPYDTGHGKVILYLENQSTYTNACQDTFDVYISDTSQNPQINFLVQTASCSHPTPKLNVEISTPFLRRCFDNNYTLSVFNESNDTAFNSYVDIELDEHLIATDTAFSSAQNLGNNSYRFYIGDVLPLQTIRKQLKVKVDCDSTILGQTHCVKATAFPYEFCNIIDAKYMQAHTACRNDSVIFTIKNIGYPENFQQHFRIIENDTITYNGILSFTQSISQNSLTYYNPTGKTYRLETRQYPMYVNEDTILSVTIEGCGNPDFSTGYVNLFSQDDDAPNVDIDCHQNVGSFDPNEKTAHPNGFGDSLYILPNTPIEYTIHFQNKGTFAASYITIIDTLSAFFDITTLQMLSSSHPFTYAIIDSNILQFTSTSINLPAEQDDTLGSNGYIKFKISPKKNIPTATTIKNTASIIFDFNTPIITNTVIRNVNDDFLKVKVISSVKNNAVKIKSTVYPNPFNQTATLSFDYQQPTQLTIFSIDGKIMQQYQSTDNFYTIDRKQLGNGMYLYELKKISNNELLDTGKLVIQ